MSDAKGSRQSDAKRQRQAKAEAGRERKGHMTAVEKAEARLSRHRQLIIAMGQHTYLRLQDVSPLAPAHCLIEPIGPAASLVDASEEVADEVRTSQKCLLRMLAASPYSAPPCMHRHGVYHRHTWCTLCVCQVRNFQKCLIRMLEAEGQLAVFLEQHHAPSRLLEPGYVPSKESMAIDCVPMTERDGKAAPAYFRKAILEAGEEWSQHRKLYEHKGHLRGTVPPGFSYFGVTFGVHMGYAHGVGLGLGAVRAGMGV